jgi:hypothetical protein
MITGRLGHARFQLKEHRARDIHRLAAGTPGSRSTAEEQRSKRAFSTDQNPT